MQPWLLGIPLVFPKICPKPKVNMDAILALWFIIHMAGVNSGWTSVQVEFNSTWAEVQTWIQTSAQTKTQTVTQTQTQT